MLGLGIGFSPIFTASILTAIITAVMWNFDNSIAIIAFATCLSIGLVGLIGCLSIWIVGSILRNIARIKKADAIKKYNNLIDDNKVSNNMFQNLNSNEYNKILELILITVKI